MIGPGTTIRGSVSGEEDLTVEGRIEGSVRTSKDLTVSKSASLEATVDAENIEINGSVTGDVTAGSTLTVAAGASVVGDVTTPRIHIADGAHFKGTVSMDFDVPSVD